MRPVLVARSRGLAALAALAATVAGGSLAPTVGAALAADPLVVTRVAQPGRDAAQPDPARRCRGALAQSRRELAAIAAEIDRGLTVERIEKLERWSRRFRINPVVKPTLDEWVKKKAADQAVSIVIELIATGKATPPGLAVTGIKTFVEVSRDTMRTVAQWRIIDENTAMYQWVLDYVEYGRQGPIDEKLESFVERHAGPLRQVTGTPPPPSGNPRTLRAYLSHYGVVLLYYFGSLEERYGADAFPRYKISVPGERYAVGYYRRVIGEKLKRELLLADRELAEMAANGCAGRR